MYFKIKLRIYYLLLLVAQPLIIVKYCQHGRLAGVRVTFLFWNIVSWLQRLVRKTTTTQWQNRWSLPTKGVFLVKMTTNWLILLNIIISKCYNIPTKHVLRWIKIEIIKITYFTYHRWYYILIFVDPILFQDTLWSIPLIRRLWSLWRRKI